MSRNSGEYIRTNPELTLNANHRYLPVMITRLMISLRKAAHLQGTAWSLDESAVDRGPGRETSGMRFVSNRGVTNRRDDGTLLSPISPGV